MTAPAVSASSASAEYVHLNQGDFAIYRGRRVFKFCTGTVGPCLFFGGVAARRLTSFAGHLDDHTNLPSVVERLLELCRRLKTKPQAVSIEVGGGYKSYYPTRQRVERFLTLLEKAGFSINKKAVFKRDCIAEAEVETPNVPPKEIPKLTNVFELAHWVDGKRYFVFFDQGHPEKHYFGGAVFENTGKMTWMEEIADGCPHCGLDAATTKKVVDSRLDKLGDRTSTLSELVVDELIKRKPEEKKQSTSNITK